MRFREDGNAYKKYSQRVARLVEVPQCLKQSPSLAEHIRPKIK